MYCYSIDQTGAMEGQIFIKTGKLISLSESFLVSCSMENVGCRGGLPSLAFEFIERFGTGVYTEASWPYKPQVRFKCNDRLTITDNIMPSMQFKTMYIVYIFQHMQTMTYLIFFKLQNGDCNVINGKTVAGGHGYISFKKGDEQDLKRAVANLGPISVAFSALDDLYDYKSGEFIRLLLLEST